MDLVGGHGCESQSQSFSDVIDTEYSTNEHLFCENRRVRITKIGSKKLGHDDQNNIEKQTLCNTKVDDVIPFALVNETSIAKGHARPS